MSFMNSSKLMSTPGLGSSGGLDDHDSGDLVFDDEPISSTPTPGLVTSAAVTLAPGVIDWDRYDESEPLGKGLVPGQLGMMVMMTNLM